MRASDIEVSVDVAAEFAGKVDVEIVARAVSSALGVALADDALPTRDRLDELAVGQVAIRIMGDDEIRALNHTFRAVDRPTDVLSFSSLDLGPPAISGTAGLAHLGDIALSYPYVGRQAGQMGHSVDVELAWLTIHGMLQILGYAHEVEAEASHMERLEHLALDRMESDGFE